jgi:5-methyltetrahydrofolate--homocysteine methyltransferase
VIDGVTMRPSRCLADFVAPKGSGIADYIGLFAVTAGLGVEKKEKAVHGRARRLLRHHAQGLADRLAEAFADACTTACAPTCGATRGRAAEQRRPDCREVPRHPPRPGYPACPDHSAKRDLFRVLHARQPTSAWA